MLLSRSEECGDAMSRRSRVSLLMSVLEVLVGLP